MKVSKVTLSILILVIAVLLAGELAMYGKVKVMKQVIMQLNKTIQQEGAVIKKLAR